MTIQDEPKTPELSETPPVLDAEDKPVSASEEADAPAEVAVAPRPLNADLADDLRMVATAEVPALDFGDVVIYGPPDEPMDIDAALASVSSLDAVIAEQQAREAEEHARQEAEARAAEEAAKRRASYAFPRPAMTTLRRGQLASVIPALVLMAVGAWLTFVLSTAQTPPSAVEVGGVLAAGLGVMLLGHWLTSGRWAQGALFGGLTILALLGLTLFLAQSDTPGAQGWPLLVVGLGVAVLLAAILSQPARGRLIFLGAAIIAGGLGTLAFSTGVLSSQWADTISRWWPLVIGAALLLIALPVVGRRRS